MSVLDGGIVDLRVSSEASGTFHTWGGVTVNASKGFAQLPTARESG